ncbi:5-(carboxyamino)imidazole ribonucleotide mutase [Macrococcus lamae]|uniref:N5-carboxyaminoimidazole ribonucleotide mutase n=1 Tax=Macrococcus lamae TaxID=198484 RepID=A0A4V3BF19_9STAP|nr:5-(carboxyamino)imidazole ribonucleotide mutase [Macrococcus lamae]TDM12375.1 5-(carboxyamino)imidazole ribonucleotide mutase [Macrococcus lamae]
MKVAVVMGSSSDWETMKETCLMLDYFKIPFDKSVVSAHRTPDVMMTFAKNARQNNIDLIIAGAGGAAHLPGMIASLTTVPVIGVPIETKTLNGMDSLLSIVQMPGGIPVATTAIGRAGAKNAGILAARILALKDESIVSLLDDYEETLIRDVEAMQHELH